ncbi:hypothetical protein AB0J86_27050 [Micromonospora sp. NPDC049559]|uniref:hypothetical protein n=1 Tax=Micromonospora sp. NPDC049559 TaxID=3155923 RepID=UPI00344292EC
MSARRLGRLLGTTLALMAIAAVLLGAADDGTLRTDDWEWSASVPAAVLDASHL